MTGHPFTDDPNVQALQAAFGATVIQAESDDSVIGNLYQSVRIGEHDDLSLPVRRLEEATPKAALDEIRADQFADHLLSLPRDQARALWKRAQPWEGDAFMAQVKWAVETKRGDAARRS